MADASGFFVEMGRDSSGKGECEFRISESKLRHFLRYGPAHKFFEAMSLPYILRNPSVIFMGLKRENLENGYCYVGIPPHRYIDHNITAPPHPGFVFAVFTDGEHRIFDWRWERADPTMPGHPIDSTTRFTTRLWAL